MERTTEASQPESKLFQSRSAGRWYVASAFISSVGLLGKYSLFALLAHLPQSVALILVAVTLSFCLFWRIALRLRRWLAPVVLLLLLVSFLVLYPKMEDVHKMGRGSDQAECVVVAGERMMHGEWPYVTTEMSSKNAMSCGPGWVAFQAPIIGLAGYRWNLMLCWLVAVGTMVSELGWDETAGIITLIGLSPGTWLTAANGSDFLTFGILLLAFCVAVRHGKANYAGGRWALAAIALGLLSQFRIVTLVIAAFFARRIGRGAAVAGWAMATAFQVAFLLWNAHSFINDGPLHIAVKLMRTAVVSDRVNVAAIELALSSAVGFVAVALFVKYVRLRQPLLLFLWVVFFVPGCEDLVIKYRTHAGLLDALGFWEGGIWVVACLPLAAAGLVEAMSPQRRTADAFASAT